MERTLAALEGWPLNVGLQAGARIDGRRRASTRSSTPARSGFKIHEDYGAYPELIDARLALRRRARRVRERSTPTGCTSRPSSRTRSRRSPAGRSTPITSRAPAAATCRT